MVAVWILVMACLAHQNMLERDACKEEQNKPKVCEKFRQEDK